MVYGDSIRPAVAVVIMVRSEATSNLAALADYGITQSEIDILNSAITDYHAVLVAAPRTAITDARIIVG